MKFIQSFLVFLMLSATYSIIVSVSVFGQSADSVVWQLSASQVPTVTGNVSAPDQKLNNMQATYANSVQKAGPTGTVGSWPAESVENPDRYMQFSVSPKYGYVFDVASISMKLYALGGSNMHANVYYSKDSTFASKIQIGTTMLLGSAPANPNVTASPAFSLVVGEQLFIRIYPWYPVQITTKYLVANTVTVSGLTHPVAYFKTSLGNISGLLQTSPTVSNIFSYSITGINLTEDVIITPPVNFEISADGGNTWKNNATPETLHVSAGAIIGQPVAIKVKMNAVSFGAYSDEIVHASSGLSRIVAVSGVYYPPKPQKQSGISFNGVNRQFRAGIHEGGFRGKTYPDSKS